MAHGKHDWEQLYKEYLASSLDLGPFLESKDINPQSQNTRENVHWWRKSVYETQRYLNKLSRTLWGDGKTIEAVENIWEMLQDWRGKSAMTHYRWAHAAGVHIELLLEKSAQLDENGIPIASNLEPRDLNALVSAMEKIQHIQRLALGLKDQTGAEPPAPPEKHIEKQETIEAQSGPIFVVEVNANGKFSRPRPRIVSTIQHGSPGFQKKEE